jgi:hypothetical protein
MAGTAARAAGPHAQREVSVVNRRFERPMGLDVGLDVATGQVELRATLCGVGLWTPAHADFDSWVAAGAPSELSVPETFTLPVANLLHPRLRRRTSTLTRAAVTTVEAALAGSGVGVDQVRYVLVSSFGEIETTVDILAQLAEPAGPVSPTKFHNSVHNTATGYLSIASGNNLESTALAGGPHNLEAGLLEALAGLAEDGGHAVLIYAEELLPAPFQRADADPTFAVALHLCADRPPAGSSGSNLELVLRNRPARSSQSSAHGVVAMFATLATLLREVARAAAGGEAGAPIVLTPACELGVEAEWTAIVRPSSEPSTGRKPAA